MCQITIYLKFFPLIEKDFSVSMKIPIVKMIGNIHME